jgi:hypothetical protein
MHVNNNSTALEGFEYIGLSKTYASKNWLQTPPQLELQRLQE